MILSITEKNILFTISYFDVFDYPMTSFEVWRYLFCQKTSLLNIMTTLDELIRKGKIEMKNGFYFLPERSNLVNLRQEKYNISEKYWDKAIKATRILSILPFIKSVVVVNSLALFNCQEDSDIDLLIITEKSKIWTTRFLSVILMWFFGIRRYGKKIRSRICLSLFMSEEKLNAYYTAPAGKEFFLAYWTAQNIVLLDRDGSFDRYLAENSWIRRFVPNYTKNITNYFLNFREPKLAKIFSFFIKILFGSTRIENILRKAQSQKIKKSQERLGNPSNVVYDDYLLKFHIHGWKRENSRDWGKLAKSLDLEWPY